MRICQYLHHAYKLQDHDFMAELFRQLLNREPDEGEMAYHLSLLASGTPRHSLLAGMVMCEQAVQNYSRMHEEGGEPPTVARKIGSLLAMSNEDFIRHLYVEFLCREPEPEGLQGHLGGLELGADRMDVIGSFLNGEEWVSLLNSERSIVSRRILAHFLESL